MPNSFFLSFFLSFFFFFFLRFAELPELGSRKKEFPQLRTGLEDEGHESSLMLCRVDTTRSLSMRSKQDSGLPMTRAASANQNVTNNIPSEKREQWPACLVQKPKDWQQRERPMDSLQNLQHK